MLSTWRSGRSSKSLVLLLRCFRKKKKEEKAKGVDIALTKDMLTNAFFNKYDVAVLIAGDGDYIPLVEEVKRFGKIVYLPFFKAEGLNPDLRLVSDYHFDREPFFSEQWKKGNEKSKVDEKGKAKDDCDQRECVFLEPRDPGCSRGVGGRSGS
jgi:uncharacterized LabA/DUF88 family protein